MNVILTLLKNVPTCSELAYLYSVGRTKKSLMPYLGLLLRAL